MPQLNYLPNSLTIIAQLVDHRDKKIACYRFDSRTANASLCPWERQSLFPIGAKQSSYCGDRFWRKTCKQTPKHADAMICVSANTLISQSFINKLKTPAKNNAHCALITFSSYCINFAFLEEMQLPQMIMTMMTQYPIKGLMDSHPRRVASNR